MKKKLIAIIFAIIALVAVGFGLTQCQGGSPVGDALSGIIPGASNSGAPEMKDIDHELTGTVKDAMAELLSPSDEDTLRQRFGYLAYQALEDAQVDPASIFNDLFKGLSFTVKNIDVDEAGTSARAVVVVQGTDVCELINLASNEVAEWAKGEEVMTTLITDGNAGLTRKKVEVLESLSGSDELAQRNMDVTLELTQDDEGNWTIVNGDSVFSQVMGGVDPSTLF